jgi:hypothetical protein
LAGCCWVGMACLVTARTRPITSTTLAAATTGISQAPGGGGLDGAGADAQHGRDLRLGQAEVGAQHQDLTAAARQPGQRGQHLPAVFGENDLVLGALRGWLVSRASRTRSPWCSRKSAATGAAGGSAAGSVGTRRLFLTASAHPVAGSGTEVCPMPIARIRARSVARFVITGCHALCHASYSANRRPG